MLRFSLVLTLTLTVATPALAGKVVHLGKTQGAVRKRQKTRRFRLLPFTFEYGGASAAVAYLRAFPKGGEPMRDKQGKVSLRAASVSKMPAPELRPVRQDLEAAPLFAALRKTLSTAMMSHLFNHQNVIARVEPEAVELGHVRAKTGRQQIAFSATGYKVKGRQRALAQVEILPDGKVAMLGLQLGWSLGK